jgi:DNA-directed RNA polymerase I subunit RPA49
VSKLVHCFIFHHPLTILATHPGLCLPNSVKFQAYTKPAPPNPKQKRSKNATSSSSSLLLHSSSHSKLDYTAKEEGPGGRESHLKHYIGVFDPTTGKLSVVEAKKLAVRGVVRSQHSREEDLQSRTASKVCIPFHSAGVGANGVSRI